MLDELGLMQRMTPHPETQELGLWLSRDEIADLLDGRKEKDQGVLGEISDLESDLRAAEMQSEDIQSGIDRIIADLKEGGLTKPEYVARELASILP